ncbi:hypothetical protein B0H10DRAFT_2197803 [Mycena sp. CBHHK59/15]|nr:hypothetical protein B0H10DRAFT_2197803 [Mycena sp. CBHHK59/15]
MAALHKSLHASDATIMSGTFSRTAGGDPLVARISRTNNQRLSLLHNALLKGLKTINKRNLLHGKIASRRLFMRVFPNELRLLDQLLMKAQTRAQIGYWTTAYPIETEEYRLLLRVLFYLRQWAEDSFRLAVEVEHFLYLLDKYHNCMEKKPHDFNHDVSEAAEEFSHVQSQSVAPPVPPTFQALLPATPAHCTSGFETSDEPPGCPFTRDSSVRFGLFAKNNRLPKNNCRMSESLNPMANIFEAPVRETKFAGDPQEADQLVFMKVPIAVAHRIHLIVIPVEAAMMMTITIVVAGAVGISLADDLEMTEQKTNLALLRSRAQRRGT